MGKLTMTGSRGNAHVVTTASVSGPPACYPKGTLWHREAPLLTDCTDDIL